MQIKIPKKIYTNEHLELFSSVQIRILNKAIRIPQVILQFRSFQANWKKVIQIPKMAIRIPIPGSSDRGRRFESLMKRFESKFQ